MDKIIIHPETGEKYNIFSSKGIEILDKYMHTHIVLVEIHPLEIH